MTSLERSALLGDKQAQKECTSRRIVLACPFCGGSDGKTLFKFVHSDLYAHKRTERCALDGMIIHNVADWNRRPAPPIGRCGECKHSTNPAALTTIFAATLNRRRKNNASNQMHRRRARKLQTVQR